MVFTNQPAISFQQLRLYPPTSCGQNLPWRPKWCVKESSSWRTAALTPFQMVNSGVLSAMHALQTSLLTSSAISSEGSAMTSSVELNTWPVQRTFKEASLCMQQACVPEWSDNRLNRWHLLCAIKDSEDNGKQEWKEPGAGQLKMGLYKGRQRAPAEVSLATAEVQTWTPKGHFGKFSCRTFLG